MQVIHIQRLCKRYWDVNEHKEGKKLVYCSSTGAIPELPKGQKIKEVKKFEGEKVLGCYSQSKALATQAVLDAVRDRDLNACVVHPSGILGPEDYAVGETTGVMIQIINGEMPAGIAGSFNLCDFTKLVAKESGCKPMKLFFPIGMANFMAKMMEKQAKKSRKRPLMTTFSVYNLARNNDYDSSKARRELGYTTRSYAETMRDEIQWLKATNKIA